ncbi:MAG: DNA primase [Gemmatimonadales bacterium]|nr:DNA primase [Gemmatimonadales bacterium]NIN12204.1 DNA primase [Gemmatimonadales bacterium]NIN50619.1 DNA primase [Gemmatimonadales bacterium]NIP08083.1 DNA primase [Gemmatimonadales bacterium]NIR03373.1 DNA primase [Gemmatimonadales bacterium]
MSPIPDELIEQVRDAADIVALVGEHVDLRKTGSDFRGPCPFHGGKHRNFAVIPKKQMFYCFVCHEAGDVFTFFMKKLGMEYPTAVREVAQRCGITIPERPTGGPDPREPLFSAVAAAAEWYARRLREADDAGPARKYLEERSFELEKLWPLGLGYAPRGEEFRTAMEKLGVTPDVMLNAGLLVRKDDGNLRPRFWNRLLFPIQDLRGRVVGFGGRVLLEGQPKYLNSPDTPIFHKGSLLYNLHDARHAVRKADRAIVVEGYFDVLRLVDAGVEEAVAPLGTAFTPEQARLIKRYTQNVILLYDSDAAGLRATFRAADVLLNAGLRVTVATPPPEQDPDTLVLRGGADAVRAVLEDALDVLERKLQLLDRKGWLASLSGRRRALDRLLPSIRAASDNVTRDLYVNRTADALGISRQSVIQEAERGRWTAPSTAQAPVTGPATPLRPKRSSRSAPERDLLRVMLREPAWRGRIAERLQGLIVLEGAERQLLDLLGKAGPAVSGGELLEDVGADARGLLAELLAEQWGSPNVDAVVDGALKRIESRALEKQLRDIDRQISVATEQEKMELAREKESLSRQIAQLNPARWKVILKRRSRSAP